MSKVEGKKWGGKSPTENIVQTCSRVQGMGGADEIGLLETAVIISPE